MGEATVSVVNKGIYCSLKNDGIRGFFPFCRNSSKVFFAHTGRKMTLLGDCHESEAENYGMPKPENNGLMSTLLGYFLAFLLV